MKIKILDDTGGQLDCFATFKRGQICCVHYSSESPHIILKEDKKDREQVITGKIFRRWLREQKIIIIGS